MKRMPPHVLIKLSRIIGVCASKTLTSLKQIWLHTKTSLHHSEQFQLPDHPHQHLTASYCLAALQTTHTAPTYTNARINSQVMCMADLAKCIVQWKAAISANSADKTASKMEGWRKPCVKEEVQSQLTFTCQTRIARTFLIAINYWYELCLG